MANCSACLITMGYGPNCALKVAGGNSKKFWMIPRCQVTDLTVEYGTNIITDITLDVSAVFYEISASKDTLSWTESLNSATGAITQTITFTIQNIADALTADLGAQLATDFAQELVTSDAGVMIIVEDRAGVKRIFGRTIGLEVSAAEKTSGAAVGDVAGNAITMEMAQPAYAPVLDTAFTIPV